VSTAAERAWAALRADFRANAPGLPATPSPVQLAASLVRTLPTVRFTAVLLLRVAQALGAHLGPAGSVVKQVNHVLTGCDFAYQAEVGPGLVLYHPTGVVVGPGCRIGARARIMQNATIGSDEVSRGTEAARSPVLGDDVFVGPGAAIFGPVELGDRVEVGANAVVRTSFGSDVVVAGVPARVVRPR
jgi:serine O-acetyltransferase